MYDARTILVATAIVFGTGAFWGFYWLPVRALTDLGLPGAWGTVAITFAATVVLSPVAFVNWRSYSQSSPVALLSVALGGAAFALYSVGFVYGRVAIIILLYFLTPIWSTLIGRYVMGWATPRLRVLAIAVGLAGLTVMLSANGEVPLPKGVGEWMALLAGLLWSISTTGIRAKSTLRPIEAAFIFAFGATIAALVLAPFLEAWPGRTLLEDLWQILGLAFVTGAIWWVLSIASLMWATVRLEPARVGILLMAEVLVGALSAALLANEHLTFVEIIGGAMVLCAGILEVWPVRRTGSARTH
ncbi:DMT family transporter [Aliiroseovarius marinus]|uniref:DMT family transporter n=1 Tax=Aliiroseovarius marinus TaxID=2500159 RepID=UPI0010620962|nr:DMT family transporter [Aliiroseovarius marinus]